MKAISALKLSKTSQKFLSVGVFVVIVASLGLTYSQQLQEKGKIDEELAVAEKRINNMNVNDLRQQQEELQEEVDESVVQLAMAEDRLVQPIKSVDVIEEFFNVAYDCDVDIINVNSSDINSEKLVSVVCSSVKINASVEGKVSDLINFIIHLNNDFSTGVVKTAQMSIKGEIDEGVSSASVFLVVYAHEGD